MALRPEDRKLMKVLSGTLRFSFFTLFLLSCSHHQKPIQLSDLSPEQLDDLNREALVLASERLGQMVTQAKANSQDSVTFLATDLFLKANMSLMEGDFSTASVLFKHVSDLVPEDDFVQKKYAISLIRMGDLETSKSVLEGLYKKSKDDKVGLILAGVYTGLDKENEARVVYEQLLKSDPKNEDACVFLGKSYAMAKETKRALDQLQKCATQDKDNGIYDYYIGKIHIDSGKIPAATAAFKRAAEKKEGHSQSVNALGMLYEEKENFQAATDLYRAHLKKQPNDSSVLARIVQVLFLKEKYEEVITYAEQLSDLEPDNLNLKVKLGILYTDAKRYPEAISVFKDLLVEAPQSDKILYYMGAIHQEMNEFQESIEYFNQIPDSSGLYTDSSVQMANMLSSLAQAEFHELKVEGDSVRKFVSYINGKIEKQKEMQVEYSVVKAGFYEGTGQYKSAMETLMVVQDEKSFSTQHKYYLANLYEKEKKFAESTALIMSVIEKEPKNAHAWNFLGYSLLVRGEEMDKAFEYINKAMAISPDDGYIRDSLGWYYYKRGEVKKALNELQLAQKKVPNDIEILKHLATVHKELKDYSKARTFLQSALKQARYQTDKEEIQSSLEAIEAERLPASKDID
jgi:tetratricopeptide (TPR) repeat protein